MKKKNIAGLIAVVMIVSVVMFLGCVKGETPTPIPRTTDGSINWEKIQDFNLLIDSNGKISSSKKMDLDNEYKDTVECYRIRYLSDGLEVVGFILKPKQVDQKLPVIIYNRGGNREFGKIDASKLKYLSYLSSNGYVVLASQYRGNDGGQGKEEFGGNDINDVLNLIPMAESLPFIDSDRIIMLGYSRGGLMTYLAISKSTKIKAACVVGGVTDIIQLYNEREQGMKNVLIELIGGTPTDKEAEYKKRSVYYWPEKINAPVLILHGEDDWKVQKSQAEKIANKLNELGKPYELVIYPKGSHGLTGNKNDRDRRILEWFEKYILTPPSPPPTPAPTPSSSSTLTPAPTLSPTPTPTPVITPTPTPAGFEVIFTIAGLLAVACLLRRRW
ncbi:MAG: Acylamino-acid-releasing enzyme [Candidatus Methanophagaceae archaeon]|nr:MAG: Acylamino-acid-releasing enzyme [Methanophagales archaeon]